MALNAVNEKLKDLTALFLTISALWAAVRSLPEAFREPAQALQEHWPWYAGLAAAFLAIGLLQRDRLLRWLAPRSKLKDASALNIGRKYLEGRADDIENLLDRLAHWRLVYLVGESGAGKSSLLEQGLLPRLRRDDPTSLAIFLDTWGADWIEGPREALAHALAPLLDQQLREKLGLVGPITPDLVTPLLGRFRDELGIIPLLLFDQFDDYQTRHRARFLRGRRKRILKPKELVQENSFWAAVAALLAEGKVHCLITTRDDAQWGLECVEFCASDTYLLGRLGKDFAANLLSAITRESVVTDPERGFDRLQERLLDDLETDGWVLPIQMKVAFRGLASLKFLTVADYERNGALQGLEALHLKDQITEAARLAGWPAREVRHLLFAMVNQESLKTTPRTVGELLKILSEDYRDLERLDQVLKKLQDAEIVRPRMDPDQRESVWALDHDYLSRGVIEFERRTRRWPLFLVESSRAFDRARGFREHWKRLLTPGQQLRIFYEWLCGRLKYGNARQYAQLSMVRFIANIWIVLLLLSSFGWSYLQNQLQALRLFSEFGEDNMTEGELQALWKLSTASPSVRQAFLRTALSHSANSRRFLVRSEAALSAAVGLDKGVRNDLLRGLVRERCDPKDFHTISSESDVLRACLVLMKDLGASIDDQVGLTVKAIDLSKDNREIYPFEDWLVHDLADKISAESTFAIWQHLFAMTQDKSRSSEAQLDSCLDGMGVKLSPETAAKAWRQVSVAMRNVPDRNELEQLAQRLEPLSKKLRPMDAKSAWDEIIPEIQGDTDRRAAIGVALKSLTERLPPRARAAAWDFMFSFFERQNEEDKEDPLGAYRSSVILWELSDELEPKDAAGAWRQAFSALTSEKNKEKQDIIISILGGLGRSLRGDDAARAIYQILNLIRRATDEERRLSLGYVLESLTLELKPSDAQYAWGRFFSRLKNMISGRQQFEFSGLLKGLAERLPVESVLPAWEQVFEAAVKEPHRIGLGEILEVLGNKLDAEESKRAWTKVLRVVEGEKGQSVGGKDSLGASELAQILRPLAKRMSSKEASAEWDRFVAALEDRSFYLGSSEMLGEVLCPLAERLAPGETSLRFLQAMELSWLSGEGELKVLSALSRRLPAKDVPVAFEKISTRPDRFAPVLESLGQRLSNSEAETELDNVLSTLRPLGKPACQIVIPILRHADDPRAIDFLKWPTCAAYRSQVVKRLGSLAGQSFEADLWKFVAWAEDRELHPELPPVPPELGEPRLLQN
jgi:conflict system STAND superfamily ATPase